jgi:hypothetical protein
MSPFDVSEIVKRELLAYREMCGCERVTRMVNEW